MSDEAKHEDLVLAMLETLQADGSYQILEGVQIHRASQPNQPLPNVPKPAFCVIAQGRKVVQLGSETFSYDRDNYLIASVDLPVISQIVEASADRPYLSLRMAFDPAMVASVLAEVGRPELPGETPVKAMAVSPLDDGLRDAVLRLVRLAQAPRDAGYLAPLVQREIIYRLLTGNQGHRLQHLALGHIATQGIAQAIDTLRHEFDRPLRIERLAQEIGMSVSGFHHHFKTVTAMSPLQFQKRLRLQEARRLLVDGLDATTAGLRVGYNNPSQFSREYKRHFGEPPMRDVERLRATATMPDRAAL